MTRFHRHQRARFVNTLSRGLLPCISGPDIKYCAYSLLAKSTSRYSPWVEYHSDEILVKFSLAVQLDVLQRGLKSHPSWTELFPGVSSWWTSLLTNSHLLLWDGALPLCDAQWPLLFHATLADNTSSSSRLEMTSQADLFMSVVVDATCQPYVSLQS